ncbi:hypothetical protein B0T22DRAFT_476950 [Podospora appendiculata]|uniref:Uncharacterized protein n=1 Tax=Podospora appendiculata TaxID=314037 RepID=A0AAE0XIN9_9PEZI|nr:hypothetical protein B0T22DRAFT_476950 [Podospora appendiculata]
MPVEHCEDPNAVHGSTGGGSSTLVREGATREATDQAARGHEFAPDLSDLSTRGLGLAVLFCLLGLLMALLDHLLLLGIVFLSLLRRVCFTIWTVVFSKRTVDTASSVIFLVSVLKAAMWLFNRIFNGASV